MIAPSDFCPRTGPPCSVFCRNALASGRAFQPGRCSASVTRKPGLAERLPGCVTLDRYRATRCRPSRQDPARYKKPPANPFRSPPRRLCGHSVRIISGSYATVSADRTGFSLKMANAFACAPVAGRTVFRSCARMPGSPPALSVPDDKLIRKKTLVN